MTWFEQLFGFAEADWPTTRARFSVDGETLHSPGGSYAIGRFSTPSLAELRHHGRAIGHLGELRVTHEAIGDVLELHALPENQGALFQVASQLNCLEFVGPTVVPEDGVTGYAFDPTQGPACALAAGAATVYRNYLVPMGEQVGQTRDRQLDDLSDLASLLGAPGAYFTVKNGYSSSDPRRLAALDERLADFDRDELLRAVRIGVQSQVGVTFASRWTPPPEPTHVSQAFCSAISCAYDSTPLSAWQPLATLVLDAAYEATLWAAIVDAAEGRGSGKVWLTSLGGGAFGNPREWIAAAISRALAVARGFDLDVRIAHYKRIDATLARRIGSRP